MTALRTAGDALLADIIACPDDDGLRLIYADWLDEHGQAERAEFIRVQVEAWDTADDLERWNALCGRAKALLTPARFREWFSGLPYGDGFELTVRTASKVELYQPDTGAAISLIVRRGFVVEVSCEWSVWRIHGPAVVRSQPIERATLSEFVPYQDTAWIRSTGSIPRRPRPHTGLLRGPWSAAAAVEATLPSVLFSCLPDRVRGLVGPATNWYEYPRGGIDAHDALSKACLCWARSQPATT